jgi:Sugar (and other) transporter
VTNFFVAFITPILLASTSSGIYFLFGSCAIATVAVCGIFMPETRGQALEAIGESFLNHQSNVGSWAPVRALRKLASRIGMRVAVSSSSSERPSVAGREKRERLEVLDGSGEPSMSGALGRQTEEVV